MTRRVHIEPPVRVEGHDEEKGRIGGFSVRLIGWAFLVSGSLAVWLSLADDEPLGTAGVIIALLGLALLGRRGRHLAAWVGGGLLTGLCLVAGGGFLGLGLLMFLAYDEIHSVAVPTLFIAWGLFLILVGGRRLGRQFRAFT